MQRHRPVTVALSVAPRPWRTRSAGPKDGPIRPADLPPFLADMLLESLLKVAVPLLGDP